MPITEVPTSSPAGSPEDQGTPPESSRSGSNSRYENLGHHELLDVIGELRDDRSRARLREMFWISLIAHMVLFWYLAYGPRYFYHIRVVDPSKVLRDRKDITYLDLPPDALKKIRPPKPTNIVSDKDRVAESKKPTIDKKTLEQLEAMKRAGPPVRQPAPQPAPPQPQQAPPQVAQQQPQPQAPPAQPLPQNNQSQLEAPTPKPTQPNFQTGPTNTRSELQEAVRNAMKGGQGQYGGDEGLNAPSQHGGMNGQVETLSDTMGVDFGPYIQRVIYDTKRAWYPIIPEAAQPPLLKQGRVAIRFRILPDGSVKSMVLEGPSGDVSLDRAAWGGITGASPYPQLPKNFKGPYLELRFYFLYNLRPSGE
jgi:TonB family protein